MWDKYPNFSADEFRCSHCNEVDMDEGFIAKLQAIRNEFGPMTISSGWRCREHPDEARKDKPGSHNQGKAADIACASAVDRYRLIALAYKHNILGVGVGKTFVHLDDGHAHAHRPAVWSY